MMSSQSNLLPSVGDGKIEVREATPGDYENVMAISENIYTGFDYLPGIYNSIMKNPYAEPYVLTKNEEVVAFKIFYISKSKRHFTTMALRVSEKQRGLGLTKILHENALDLFKKKHPTLHKILLTGVWAKGIQSYVDKSETARALLTGKFLVYRLTSAMTILSNFEDNYHCEDPTQLTVEQQDSSGIKKHLTQSVIDRLIPQKMFIYASTWTPEETEESVFRDIMENLAANGSIVCSFQESGEVSSLSFGNVDACPYGKRYNFYYHGKDLQDLVAHFLKHIWHLMNIAPDIDNLGIFVFFSNIEIASVKKALALIGEPVVNEVYPAPEYAIIEEDC